MITCVGVGNFIFDQKGSPMFADERWSSSHEMTAVEMPVGLSHVESGLCWCDPLVEMDEEGKVVLVHRQVTWN